MPCFFHARKGVRYVAKLSDKQRKKIIAEYVAGDGKVSQEQLAKKYGVSRQAISLILKDKKACESLRKKKKENEMSMLAFLDSRSVKAQGLIDQVLETLPSDFEKASMRDKAGLLKILAETFGRKNETQSGTEPTKIIHTNAEMSEKEVEELLDE